MKRLTATNVKTLVNNTGDERLIKLFENCQSESAFLREHGAMLHNHNFNGMSHQTVYNAKKYNANTLSKTFVLHENGKQYLARVELKIFGRDKPRGME